MTFIYLFWLFIFTMIFNFVTMVFIGGILDIFYRLNDEKKINVMHFRK